MWIVTRLALGGLALGLLVPCFADGAPQVFQDPQGLYGVRAADGKVLIAPQFTCIESYNPYRATAACKLVSQGNKSLPLWGVVDGKGVTLVPFRYPQLRQACHDGWAFSMAQPGKPDQNWGLINVKGQVVAAAIYPQIGKSPAFPVPVATRVGGSPGKPEMRWGLMGADGKFLQPPRYRQLFHSDFAFCFQEENGLWGAADSQGKLNFSAEYEELRPFHTSKYRSDIGDHQPSLAIVRKNGLYGVLRDPNTLVLPCQYSEIRSPVIDQESFEVVLAGKVQRIAPDGKAVEDPPAGATQTFQERLEASKNSDERIEAFSDYIRFMSESSWSPRGKFRACRLAAEKMKDLDFFACWAGWKQNLTTQGPLCYQYWLNLSPAEDKAFGEMTDHFIANCQNSTTQFGELNYPLYLPQPGMGWGKKKNSDGASSKPVLVSRQAKRPEPAASPASKIPKNDYCDLTQQQLAELNRDLGMLTGRGFEFTTSSGRSRGVVTGYEWRVAHVWMIEGKSVPGYPAPQVCLSTDEGRPYFLPPELFIQALKSGQMVRAANAYAECSSATYIGIPSVCGGCGGTGTVTTSGSHTNDYTYTMGQTHTYYWSTKSGCSACQSSGHIYRK